MKSYAGSLLEQRNHNRRCLYLLFYTCTTLYSSGSLSNHVLSVPTDQAEGERHGAEVLPEGGAVSGGAELGAEAVRAGPRPAGGQRVRLGSQSRVRVSDM